VSTQEGITLKAALERWSAAELTLASPNLLPDLGVSLLEGSFDVPEVVRLAICDRDAHPADLRTAAAKAFAALGVDTEMERLHEIVLGRRIAEQVLSEEVSPEVGLHQMNQLWVLTGYSELFKEWRYLKGAVCLFRDGYGGLEPFTALTEESIPSTTRLLAQQFLDSHPLPLK
jgi:hypothetical protein